MGEHHVIEPQQESVDTPLGNVDYGHALISSRRGEGTPVYGRSGERLGAGHTVMIEKQSGRVPYVVLEFGGFLGVGSRVFPVPWQVLTYDVDRDGYVVDMSKDQLAEAPSMRLDDTDRPIDRDYQERVSSYGGTMPWGGL